MSKVTYSLTPEQQELLDSGLRMLAHMIAETHLRRTVLRTQNESTTRMLEMTNPIKREKIRGSSDEHQSEDNYE